LSHSVAPANEGMDTPSNTRRQRALGALFAGLELSSPG